jgi:curli biogenesis system outer membrane secretion channel CsgG
LFDCLLSGKRGDVRFAGSGIVEKLVKACDFAVLDRDNMREIRRVLFIGRFRAG